VADTLQENIRTIVDRHAGSLVNSGGAPSASQAPGGMVGVYFGGESFFVPYGKINAAGDPPTENTLFGLGSVTKTFTTAILGQQTELFVKSIKGFAPEGITIHWPRQPTFEQLATFTGGIQPGSPVGVETQAEFVKFINNIGAPYYGLPAPNVYSDASIGLLGQTLMNMEGYTSFDAASTFEWFSDKLLSPLGMDSTLAPRVESPLLATPYAFNADTGEYQEVEYRGWCPWGTAGRMFSTAADMIRFITAAVGVDTIGGMPVPRKVLDGIAQSLQPWATIADPPPCSGLEASRQAFAWVVWTPEPIRGTVIRSKAGGVRGVSSYLAVNPALGYGVIVLLNQMHVLDQCPTIGIMMDLLYLATQGS
jgi:CubicO group peptidase (beta-lactamase class C family)